MNGRFNDLQPYPGVDSYYRDELGDVRFGSEADISECPLDFRLTL